MRKTIGIVSSLAVAALITLTGCTGGNLPDPVQPTMPAVAPAINPISSDKVDAGSSQFTDGLTLNVQQIGYGYPSERQMKFFNAQPTNGKTKSTSTATATPSKETKTTTPTPKASDDNSLQTGTPLVDTRRVVAVTYTVTNTTGEAVDVRQFNNLIGYFKQDKADTPVAHPDYSDDSLHGLLGASSYPVNFDPQAEKWMLNPGESATWALDWLVPENLNDAKDLTLVQNFSVGTTFVSSGVEFNLKTTKPDRKVDASNPPGKSTEISTPTPEKTSNK